LVAINSSAWLPVASFEGKNQIHYIKNKFCSGGYISYLAQWKWRKLETKHNADYKNITTKTDRFSAILRFKWRNKPKNRFGCGSCQMISPKISIAMNSTFDKHLDFLQDRINKNNFNATEIKQRKIIRRASVNNVRYHFASFT
jgi:hypothetical protein